jgi:aryl-alcohol dehydrogenase-like predicted oxidoreductase
MWPSKIPIATDGESYGHHHAHGDMALAYVLHKPFVTSVIIGAKDVAQLDDNLGATDLALGADEMKRLDEVSALPSEYPGWMIDRQSGERATPVR